MRRFRGPVVFLRSQVASRTARGWHTRLRPQTGSLAVPETGARAPRVPGEAWPSRGRARSWPFADAPPQSVQDLIRPPRRGGDPCELAAVLVGEASALISEARPLDHGQRSRDPNAAASALRGESARKKRWRPSSASRRLAVSWVSSATSSASRRRISSSTSGSTQSPSRTPRTAVRLRRHGRVADCSPKRD
jgi:hypothetical protein